MRARGIPGNGRHADLPPLFYNAVLCQKKNREKAGISDGLIQDERRAGRY